jgi:methionine synthase II (cobalamin-independent)
MHDYSMCLKEQIKSLIGINSAFIQIDDPHFLHCAKSGDQSLLKYTYLTEALNVGEKNTTKFALHSCVGNPYSITQPASSPFQRPYYASQNALLLNRIPYLDYISIEDSHLLNNVGFDLGLFEKDLMFGVIDVTKRNVESVEYISDIIYKINLEALLSHRNLNLIVTPDCGLKHMDLCIATKKILNLVAAVQGIREA